MFRRQSKATRTLAAAKRGSPYHRANAAEGHAVDRQMRERAVKYDGREEAVPLPLLRDCGC